MRALRTFIVNKQEGQFKKGDLSKWVGIAINNLTAGYSTHALSTQNPNPYQIPKGRLKVKNMMQDICNQLIQSGLRQAPINPESTIPLKHLDQMIRDVTGHHDERTIRNHKQDLIKYGYLVDKGYSGALMIKDTGTDIEHIERVMDQQRRDERNKKQEQEQERTELKNGINF
jgi:hypothetical protein